MATNGIDELEQAGRRGTCGSLRGGPIAETCAKRSKARLQFLWPVSSF